MNRRALFTTGLVAGAILPVATAVAGPRRTEEASRVAHASEFGLVPNHGQDQSQALQIAIDQTAASGAVLSLSPGRYLVRDIRLRPGVKIIGTRRSTIIGLSGSGRLLVGDRANDVHLEGLALEAEGRALTGEGHLGLLALHKSSAITVRDLDIRMSPANGIVLTGCSGSVQGVTIIGAQQAGLLSLDATGLEIAHNTVTDCANNGILVWRTAAGEDGTIVAHNRIERIRATAGGTGQNGNGVNVFRATGVLVTGNRIADCAYSAVRGNASSNIQIVANQATRIGEVALYAEFGFEGALIASNLVDGAATGISVTNFNEGGRLAVIQGNLIRNLRRREAEPQDKRGEGIAVEADATITGNTIENAPTVGIMLGWGRYMRDVAATSNVIRNTAVGIMISRDPDAGSALIAQNLISGARDGAIRAMDQGQPVGPDLAKTGTTSVRVSITGNMVSGSNAA